MLHADFFSTNYTLEKTEHHAANLQELVKEITKIRVEEGELFVSYDVVSLFMKTPIKEA